MLNLSMNCIGEERKEAARFCREHDLGLELTDFGKPDNLDGDLAGTVREVQSQTGGVSFLSSHGPFLDLIATSRDGAIRELCRRRHEAALQASIDAGARIYVAHTNFNPMIRNPPYIDNFPARSVDFWLPFAEKAARNGVTIVLENLWEQNWEIPKGIVDLADHPGLKMSYDVGHGLVFSDRTAPEWIGACGERIAHFHLHDNHGARDEHNPVGEGTENWPAFLESIAAHSPRARLVIESDMLAANRTSYDRLIKLMGADI